MAKRSILYFDLYDDILGLPFAEATSLFNPGDRHYSIKGNKFMAQKIYEKLFSLEIFNSKKRSSNNQITNFSSFQRS